MAHIKNHYEIHSKTEANTNKREQSTNLRWRGTCALESCNLRSHKN